MLVASAARDASLIESAKSRTLLNEIFGYKRAVYTFYTVENRLPGDLNGSGKIGKNSGQSYNAASYPTPYNSDTEEGIPNIMTAPFVDLYLKNIIDFQPKKVNSTGNEGLSNNGALPLSKLSKDYMYFSEYYSSQSYFYVTKSGNWMYLFKYTDVDNLNARYFKHVDEKIDDGIFDSGNVASDCGNKDYS